MRLATLVFLATALPVSALAAPAPATPSHPDADGFIQDWLVLAPIFYQGLWPAGEEELDRSVVPGEATLKPKAGDAVKVADASLTWKEAKASDYGLDLAAATDTKETKHKLGFAVTYLVAEAPVKGVRLRVGSNDLAKFYFNGKPVIRSNKVRALGKDQNAALVDLKKGVNVLTAKVINDETRWQVAARLVEAGGKPVPNLKVASTPDGKGTLTAPDAEGFVREWLVLGPIAYKPRPYALGQLAKKQLPSEEKLAPHAGERAWVNTGDLPWTPYKAPGFAVDFNEYAKTMRKYTPPARVEANETLFMVLGYAVSYVTAAQDMKDLTVKIGANDHAKLYVNGQVVATKETPGKLEKDAASGKVSLKKGVNTLVLKVVNAGDAWEGCVRFVDKSGKPVTDLEVRTSPAANEEQKLLVD